MLSTLINRFGWILVALFILLQPFKNWFEAPIALMAVIGLVLLVKQPKATIGMPGFKVMMVVFAGIWLPMVASLTDAVSFQRSLETTMVFLRFPLMAIFVMYALKDTKPRVWLLLLFGSVLTFAALDVLVQAAWGRDLFGFVPDHAGRMSGIIPHKLVIGHILAAISAAYFYWIWCQDQQKKWVWVLVPVYIAAILLTGARVAWILLAVSLFMFALQLYWVEKIKPNRVTWFALVLMAVVAVGIGVNNNNFRDRVLNTVGVFSGKYEQMNEATALRLPIWNVAFRIAQDHWVNGIGPRGFRYEYVNYVPKDDYWLIPRLEDGVWQLHKYGPNHPHQFLLEVFAETGIIGVLGYLFAFWYWIRFSIRAAREHASQALPWMAAVFVASMPINAHMAFYASFWSCMTWWLIAISLAFWQAGLNKESAIA